MLSVTPTLLRTPAQDGTPRVRVIIDASRTSALAILDADPAKPTVFEKVSVNSEAVLSLGQTLVLSGFSQRERHFERQGVPVLGDIPILGHLFSKQTTVQSDAAVIVLLTPRDPHFLDERNKKEIAKFVEMRRAFLKASQGPPEDMRQFRESYPGWHQMPNGLATHFFMLENNELYRAISGQVIFPCFNGHLSPI